MYPLSPPVAQGLCTVCVQLLLPCVRGCLCVLCSRLSALCVRDCVFSLVVLVCRVLRVFCTFTLSTLCAEFVCVLYLLSGYHRVRNFSFCVCILYVLTVSPCVQGSCVLYPNGEVDPWHSLSVLQQPSPGIEVLMVGFPHSLFLVLITR